MPRKATGRKSGAQPGNLNRLTHGFYSQQLRELDIEGANALSDKLEAEVALVRGLLLKYLELAKTVKNYRQMGNVLELASRAANRIGNLVRIQDGMQRSGGNEGLQAIISRILKEMDEELELDAEMEARVEMEGEGLFEEAGFEDGWEWEAEAETEEGAG